MADINAGASQHDHQKIKSAIRGSSQNGVKQLSSNKERDLQQVKHVVSRYVNQMLHGCGNSECKQTLCDNGRQNAIGRPIRRYTPRSARMVALTLASGPRPRSRLCLEQHQSGASSGNGQSRNEGPRDPYSVNQLLADTEVFRQLSEPGPLLSLKALHDIASSGDSHVHAIRIGHAMLDDADFLLQSRTGREEEDIPKTMSVVGSICMVLHRLVAALMPEIYDTEDHHRVLSALDNTVQTGNAQIRASDCEAGVDVGLVVAYSDILADPPRTRLFQRCLSLVSRLASQDPPPGTPTLFTWSRTHRGHYHAQVATWLNQNLPGFKLDVLHIWLKMLFLKDWDGTALLSRDSPALACLSLMEGFKTIEAPEHDNDAGSRAIRQYGQLMILASHNAIEIPDLAKSWLHLIEDPGESRPVHLLEAPWHFSGQELEICFRTINHLRMQHAHSDAGKAGTLRERTVRSEYVAEGDPRLAPLENHYLLLSISRNSVLRDTFDQIWQRRSIELLRPLRVRLGETDFEERGHDLGGVQIEFFNLFCKELFSEELGMFTSDPTTGLSYFRPGSLQPLYMFELCGLLFALALYNGITLPVNLPLPFYALLLSFGPNLDNIREGWPAMHRSLAAVQEQDIPGLDYVFSVEANGVRLAISSLEQEDEQQTPEITARVSAATAIVHETGVPGRPTPASGALLTGTSSNANIIDIEKLTWPGWSFESPPSDEPREITPGNKEQYIKRYVHFLTCSSVAPQWHHFLRGFHRILPASHLTLFSPGHLRSLVEGTQTLSIPDLRSITQYYQYNPDGPYINSFWSLVASWPTSKQKQLLKFVTAAERLPAGGAKAVVFQIHRLDFKGAEETLPTSSTCFGTLNLPKYSSVEVLEQKLTVALEMGLEGFGTG